MIRALPGGIPGIRSLAEQFHSRGVKMLVPFHIWDVGTRRERCPSVQPGCNATGDLMSDADAMAALLTATDVDGFNGDAEDVVTQDFFTAAMARNHPLAFEPESEVGANPLAVIEWDTLVRRVAMGRRLGRAACLGSLLCSWVREAVARSTSNTSGLSV